MRTNQDRINRTMAPALAALLPREHYTQQVAHKRAIDRAGNVRPGAVPVSVSRIRRTVNEAGTTASTSSTSVWEDAISSDDLILPEYGTWELEIDVGSTLSNSAAGDVDIQVLLNGEVVLTSAPTAPSISNGGAYWRQAAVIPGIAASTTISVVMQIKSVSTGTSTARRSVLKLDANRQ